MEKRDYKQIKRIPIGNKPIHFISMENEIVLNAIRHMRFSSIEYWIELLCSTMRNNNNKTDQNVNWILLGSIISNGRTLLAIIDGNKWVN